MTLIEAMKSGFRFKRRAWSHWSWVGPLRTNDGATLYFQDEAGKFCIQPESVMADDYEIDEPSITITRTQFDAICRRIGNSGHFINSPLADDLRRLLGFRA